MLEVTLPSMHARPETTDILIIRSSSATPECDFIDCSATMRPYRFPTPKCVRIIAISLARHNDIPCIGS